MAKKSIRSQDLAERLDTVGILDELSNLKRELMGMGFE